MTVHPGERRLEPAEAQPSGPLTGTTLDGRYLVEGLLGEGGMGVVYAARHIHLEKKLAVKVLRSDASRDPDLVDRFQREARAATAIGSEHIVDISDFGKTPDGSTYFVMEYLGGSSLGDVLAAGPMSIARTLHVSKQICEALGAAHQRGIVHRDLKPDNIYLVRRGGDSNFVKILDFGIAKVGKAAKRLTVVGQVFGTPHYMSPEQAAGEHVDGRSDVYALGVILYEMVTGQVPFDSEQTMAILTKHLYSEPVPPRQTPAGGDTPPKVEALILRCLAKKPDDRPATMEDVAIELESFEYDLPTGVRASLGLRMSDSQSEYRLPADGSGGYRVPKLDVLSQSAERDVSLSPAAGTAIPVGLMEASQGAFTVASEPSMRGPVLAATTGVQARALREPTEIPEPPKRSSAPLVIGVLAILLLLVGGGIGVTYMVGAANVATAPTATTAPRASATDPSAPTVGEEPTVATVGSTATPTVAPTTPTSAATTPAAAIVAPTASAGTAPGANAGARADEPDEQADTTPSQRPQARRVARPRVTRQSSPPPPFVVEPRRQATPRTTPGSGTPGRTVRDPWGAAPRR